MMVDEVKEGASVWVQENAELQFLNKTFFIFLKPQKVWKDFMELLFIMY